MTNSSTKRLGLNLTGKKPVELTSVNTQYSTQEELIDHHRTDVSKIKVKTVYKSVLKMKPVSGRIMTVRFN